MPKIAVYGLGKLGLPIAAVLAGAGFEVIGVDPNVTYDKINTTEPDVSWADLDNLSFFREPQESDVSFIVVPTPSLPDGSFDVSNVMDALEHCHKVNTGCSHVAVIVSTVSPGSCEQLAQLHQTALFSVVYNPTFIALGSVVSDLKNPDLLLIGGDHDNARLDVVRIWNQVMEPDIGTHIHIAGFTEVELIKLSVNAVLGTKISLANSLGMLFEAYGVPASAVTSIGKDHRIGTDYFTPGSPITGPCLPRDNIALQTAAKHIGVSLPISKATEEIQSEVYQQIIEDVFSDLNSLGILGMSYKYGVAVDTDAIGPFLQNLAEQLGLKVFTYDSDLPANALEDVLDCDVIVVTLPEYKKLIPHDCSKRVVNLWP